MTNEEQGQIVRLEASLLRIPVFALAVRGSAALDGFEFRATRRKGDRAVEMVVRTERDDATPYPGPLSRRVHMGLLSLIADRGLPIENPLSWSWRDLCRRMELPASGRRDVELKTALRATWGLKIFGLSSREGRDRETWRRLYADCEFLNETRQNGSIVGANRLWLSPWYLDSLNALHTAPIEYGLWKRLEAVGPLASRLYEYLVPAFYRRETLELSYDRLTSAMPVVAEGRRSHAIRQFSASLEVLKTEKLIAAFAWDVMKGTGRPKLVLERGARLAPPPSPLGEESRSETTPALSSASYDPNEPKRLAGEFYRLLGKVDTKPLRSDLAVAGSLLVRFGADVAITLLPTAVRLLKARFRNAETMGALVRYMDEAARGDDLRRGDAERQERDRADRAAESARWENEEIRRKAEWIALPEAEKARLRAEVLADHPSWRRHPALVEAQCVDRLLAANSGHETGAREIQES